MVFPMSWKSLIFLIDLQGILLLAYFYRLPHLLLVKVAISLILCVVCSVEDIDERDVLVAHAISLIFKGLSIVCSMWI